MAGLARRPLMLACLCLLLGTVLAHHTDLSPAGFVGLCLLSVLVAVATVRATHGIGLVAILVGAMALGAARYETATIVPGSDISHLAGAKRATIEGAVVSEPEQQGWGRRFRLRVDGVARARPASREVSGTALVRAPRDVEVELGDRVRLSQVAVKLPAGAERPGEFSYRRWLARQGVTALVSAGEVERSGRDGSWRLRLARLGLGLRRRVVGGIDRAMPGADAALYSRLLVGMVYGLEASPLPEEIVEEFRRAGTVHLLVVSGAQVSMVAIALLGLTGATFRNLRWWQLTLTAAGVLVLVLIVGMEASVGRAVAMFALLMLAAFTRRDYDVYTALALAAALICIIDPFALLSLSFQLTFAATLGVVLFLPAERLQRVDGTPAAPPLPHVRAVLWGTIGAWALTTPLLAHSFSGFALSGNLANLANVPLSFLIMVLGFVALPVALLPGAGPLLTALCWLARGLLRLVIHVNVLAASLPLSFAEDLHLSLAQCVLWYLGVAAIVASGLLRRARRRLDDRLLRLHPNWPWVAGLALVSVMVTSHFATGAAPSGLEVTFLPVGAGQCAVIRAPSGATTLADCGGCGNCPGGGDEVADGVVTPFLSRRRIERVDAVAVSHWDADHYNALPRLLQRVRVGLLLLPLELPDARPPKALLGEIARGVPARAGGVLRLSDGVTVEVLEPRLPPIAGGRDAANDNSVVLMVRHGGFSVLLTGDIGREGMRRLLRDARSSGRSLRADVLVLPHHGRNQEGLEELLDAVAPRWAVASCDWRAEQYLRAQTLEALRGRGIELLRTDEHGAIRFVSDGRGCHVDTSHGPRSTVTRIAAARR